MYEYKLRGDDWERVREGKWKGSGVVSRKRVLHSYAAVPVLRNSSFIIHSHCHSHITKCTVHREINFRQQNTRCIHPRAREQKPVVLFRLSEGWYEFRNGPSFVTHNHDKTYIIGSSEPPRSIGVIICYNCDVFSDKKNIC